jgi:hypothetical protein
MENMKTFKEIRIFIIEFIIGEGLSFFIDLTYNYKGKNIITMSIIENIILIGSIATLLLIGITYLYLRDKQLRITVKALYVKSKVYDVMFQKFRMRYKSHPCTIFPEDRNLFSDEENKILKDYFVYLKTLEGKIMVNENK